MYMYIYIDIIFLLDVIFNFRTTYLEYIYMCMYMYIYIDIIFLLDVIFNFRTTYLEYGF